MSRRNRLLALAGFGLLLLVEVPIFLRSPLWVDATLWDVAAWTVLHGGVMYRDVFETNLPGMLVPHVVVRGLFGYSHEALRSADLLMFLGVLALLDRGVRAAGASGRARFWLAFACAHFYLLETEFVHVQRDTWMFLPALAAFACRRQRFLSEAPSSSPNRWALREGLLWGAAIWVKPHALVPMTFLWAQGAIWRKREGRGRTLVGESLAQLAGLALMGAGGLIAVALSGTWSPMWDVLLNWNGEYYEFSWAEYENRVTAVIMHFSPWSLIHYAAFPLALWNVFGRPRRERSETGRAMLDMLYLGWIAQAILLQKVFPYAHVPVTLLALASMTARRWPAGPVMLCWSLVGASVVFAAEHSPLVRSGYEFLGKWKPATTRQVIPDRDRLNVARLRHWPACWGAGGWALKARLSDYVDSGSAPQWEELGRVEQFLRTLAVGDGDLVAWGDTTHPLYLMLDIRPGYRYQHVMTALGFRSKRGLMLDDLNRSRAKLIVSDLIVPYTFYPFAPDDGSEPGLPYNFPAEHRDLFPWDQPVIFRTRRYLVHRFAAPAVGPLLMPQDVPLPGN